MYLSEDKLVKYNNIKIHKKIYLSSVALPLSLLVGVWLSLPVASAFAQPSGGYGGGSSGGACFQVTGDDGRGGVEGEDGHDGKRTGATCGGYGGGGGGAGGGGAAVPGLRT